MPSPNVRAAAIAVVLASSLAAQAYESNFETLNASAAGTLLSGQDNYYLPSVASSTDWNAYTYAGNTLNIPQNLVGGGQFIAGVSQGTLLARAQRAIAFNAAQPWQFTVDVCCNFNGTPPAADFLGSFSEQPNGTNASFILLCSWGTNTANPVLFNIATQVYDSAGVAQAIVAVPDPNFQNLSVLTWYRVQADFDFVTNQITQLSITNLTTFITNTYTPTNWYMFGGAVGAPLPTDFRFFCGGGIGNVVACDNISISAAASFDSFGTGCPGSLGVPGLAASASSLPIPGNTFFATLSNLPLNAGVVAAGFSNTVTGPFTLPLSLTQFGLAGCTLYVDPAVTQFLVGTGNQATWSLSLPNNPGLLSLRAYVQGFSLDPTANAAGLSVSNARRLIIGR
jgi:hypothetical protein